MTSIIITSFLLLTICLCNLTNGSRQQRICMQLESVDVPDDNLWRDPRGQIQTIPGKKGPKGERGSIGMPGKGIKGETGRTGPVGRPGISVKGEQGPQGAPGEVDYGRIQTILEEQMDTMYQKLEEKVIESMMDFQRKINETIAQFMQTTNEKISNIKKRLTVAELKAEGLCPVQHSGHCFWVVMQRTTQDAAEEICARDNGLPANIYSERHLTDIMAEVRTKMTKNTIYIWTGMNVHLTTGAVSMRNGTPAPYIKWWTGGFPQPNEAGLYIYVKSDANSADQGMGNDPPTTRQSGVVCEY